MNLLRRDGLGGTDEVPFVFAFLGVNDNDHPPGFQGVESLVNGVEAGVRHGGLSGKTHLELTTAF